MCLYGHNHKAHALPAVLQRLKARRTVFGPLPNPDKCRHPTGPS